MGENPPSPTSNTLDQTTESLAALLVEKAMDEAMRRQGLVD